MRPVKRAMNLSSRARVPVALGLCIALPVGAHHSTTYFDTETQVVHEDVTVVRFDVANPHGILVYVVTDEAGNEQEWDAELPSANFTRRAGIDGSILSPGDKLTLVSGQPGLPGRTRERLMRLERAEFPNGDVATFTGISATLTRAGEE